MKRRRIEEWQLQHIKKGDIINVNTGHKSDFAILRITSITYGRYGTFNARVIGGTSWWEEDQLVKGLTLETWFADDGVSEWTRNGECMFTKLEGKVVTEQDLLTNLEEEWENA